MAPKNKKKSQQPEKRIIISLNDSSSSEESETQEDKKEISLTESQIEEVTRINEMTAEANRPLFDVELGLQNLHIKDENNNTAPACPEDCDPFSILVKNIPAYEDSESGRKTFSKFGKVVDVVKYPGHEMASVTFAETASALKARAAYEKTGNVFSRGAIIVEPMPKYYKIVSTGFEYRDERDFDTEKPKEIVQNFQQQFYVEGQTTYYTQPMEPSYQQYYFQQPQFQYVYPAYDQQPYLPQFQQAYEQQIQQQFYQQPPMAVLPSLVSGCQAAEEPPNRAIPPRLCTCVQCYAKNQVIFQEEQSGPFKGVYHTEQQNMNGFNNGQQDPSFNESANNQSFIQSREFVNGNYAEVIRITNQSTSAQVDATILERCAAEPDLGESSPKQSLLRGRVNDGVYINTRGRNSEENSSEENSINPSDSLSQRLSGVHINTRGRNSEENSSEENSINPSDSLSRRLSDSSSGRSRDSYSSRSYRRSSTPIRDESDIADVELEESSIQPPNSASNSPTSEVVHPSTAWADVPVDEEHDATPANTDLMNKGFNVMKKKTQKNTIIVSEIGKGLPAFTLRNIFMKFGDVKRIKAKQPEPSDATPGNFKQAVVVYGGPEEVAKALEESDNLYRQYGFKMEVETDGPEDVGEDILPQESRQRQPQRTPFQPYRRPSPQPPQSQQQQRNQYQPYQRQQPQASESQPQRSQPYQRQYQPSQRSQPQQPYQQRQPQASESQTQRSQPQAASQNHNSQEFQFGPRQPRQNWSNNNNRQRTNQNQPNVNRFQQSNNNWSRKNYFK